MDNQEIKIALVQFDNQNKTLMQEVMGLMITTPEIAQRGQDILSDIKRTKKAWQLKLDGYVNPLKDVIAGLKLEFDIPFGKLEQMEIKLKGDLLAFTQKENARKAEEQRKQDEALKANQKEADKFNAKIMAGKNPNKIKAPEVKAVPIVAPETKLAGGYTVKRWVAEVLDENIVPVEFKSIDMVKINSAIKMGIRSIPGVKIYEREDYRSR